MELSYNEQTALFLIHNKDGYIEATDLITKDVIKLLFARKLINVNSFLWYKIWRLTDLGKQFLGEKTKLTV